MGLAEVRKFLDKLQKALKVVAVLQFTAYLYPPNAIVKDGDSFDFIIVGAGTAGSVIANRLTKNASISVLLIEAGGDAPIESDLPGPIFILKRSDYDWNYDAQPDNYFGQCHLNPYFEMTLGKMLGGTSSLNFLIFERGTPKQFAVWADAVNDSTWRWENVVPYYEKSSKLMQSKQQMPDDESDGCLRYIKEVGDLNNYFEAYAELGYSVEDPSDDKVNTYYKLKEAVANGERQSSASSFLTPIKNRQNLKVLKFTHVNKILFDANNNAVGVEATKSDGTKITLKATKEVIVSAGVMNTPKLLMLSGIGPRKHLESLNIELLSDLPVGDNLQDQVSVSVVHNMEILETELEPLNPHAYPPISYCGFVALNASQGFSDYHTVSFIVNAEIIRTYCTFVFRYNDEICTEIYNASLGRHQVFNQVSKLHPKSKGKVMLRSADPADSPLINPNYLNNVEDLEDLARYLANFAKVMNTTYFKSVGANIVIPSAVKCGDMVPDSVDYWKCYATCMIGGMSSFTGTCAMGPVVDARLNVRGVQRLRVADASVIPASMNYPYGTIVMIGEKVAEFIRKDYNF